MEIFRVPIQGNPRGEVVILSSGVNPEDLAMLQALYSRDPNSIHEHLKKLGARKIPFMKQYYVGYGHDSIGDCGNLTIFVEGISMWAAKRIQSTRLYSGQEVSTRYVDYSKQPFLFSESEELRQFYVDVYPVLKAQIAADNNIDPETATMTQKNSVNAATFDVLRGFLPLGAETSCSWTTNIRQLNDHLQVLFGDELSEIREIAKAIRECAIQYLPNSIKELVPRPSPSISFSTENFIGVVPNQIFPTKEVSEEMRSGRLSSLREPAAVVRFLTSLDIGSWRDLQRHRGITQIYSVPNIDLGFEEWYLLGLPEQFRERARLLLEKFEKRFRTSTEPNRIYSIPMGYRIRVYGEGGLFSMSYIAKIRSAPTVHPTLQRFAKDLGREIENVYGEGSVHYNSGEVKTISLRRGTQTIQPI